MSRKHRSATKRIIYASPLLFAAACALLVLIIGVFAVKNVQREKQMLTTVLTQEGAAILGFVSSSARSVLRSAVMRGVDDAADWRQLLQQVIENGSEHPRIAALYIVDDGGLVFAHSEPGQIGAVVPAAARRFFDTAQANQARMVWQIVDEVDGQALFQAAVRLAPVFPMAHDMGRGRMGRMHERLSTAEQERLLAALGRQDLIVVAELHMDEFSAAIRKQFIQIGILSLVLLLVGAGGILSLMTLQGLRGSHLRLTRMREFTEVLVASLPVGIVATGPDDRVRTCNESASSMLDLQQKQVVERPLSEVLPDRLRGLDILSPESRSHREVTLPAKDGTERSLHITRLALKDPARLHAGTVLLIQDLSQIKKLESELERAERDAAVGRMAAGVAHEIRNPLSSIKGLALLLKGRLQEDRSGKEALDLLVAEVERLNRSIGELLDYARPAQLQLEMVEIDEVVRKAVTLLGSDALTGGIAIDENYGCAGIQLNLDGDKLIQVILNLGLNAMQAMPDGGRVRVTTGRKENLVTITIADDGAGIEPAVLARVFDPYFTTKQNGTGLGLAMSKKIIDDHRGRLSLSSTPGEGTAVIIELPCTG